MDYIFDTNIFVYYIKDRQDVMQQIEDANVFDQGNTLIISVVTRAELMALAIKNSWGRKKLSKLESYLNQFLQININSADLLDAYAEVDAFGFDKHPSLSLGGSHKIMGKNDLWIAATALVVKATILTADGDFDHLSGKLLDIEKVIP